MNGEQHARAVWQVAGTQMMRKKNCGTKNLVENIPFDSLDVAANTQTLQKPCTLFSFGEFYFPSK